MARPIEFDEQAVVQKAMEAFWSNGVEAITIAELLEATGLARSSFYNSYGSKDALVIEALERYADDRVASLRRVLGRDRFEDALRALLGRVISDNNQGRGCLLLNFAVEAGAARSTAAPSLRAGIRRMVETITERVEQAQREGELGAAVQPLAIAMLVCTTIAGLRTFTKAGMPKDWLRQAADLAVSSLCRAGPASPRPRR